MSDSVFMASGAQMMSRGMIAKHVDVTPEARVSFFVAFGVTPDEQTALEEYYGQWKLVPLVQEVGGVDEVDCCPL